MNNKGCLMGFMASIVVIALVGALVIGGLAVVIKSVQIGFNPVYHGKHLLEWADEAVRADDHEARQRAVEVLREACDHEGEDARLHLYYHLVDINGGIERRDALPAELVSFLLGRFEQEDLCAGMVAASLGRCPASDVVPGLVGLLQKEWGPYKRGQLIQTLGQFGNKARQAIPLIQKSLHDKDSGVRETARQALKHIDPAGNSSE